MLWLLAAAQSTLGSVWWPEVDGFCKDGICFPSVCSAGKLESRWNLTDGSVPSWLRYQPPAYMHRVGVGFPEAPKLLTI